MPAIWHRKFTVRTRKFDGGCAAATTTCRAGAASVARKSSVTVCPGNRYSTPPSTAMLFLQSSSVLSRQRMASRSSRSLAESGKGKDGGGGDGGAKEGQGGRKSRGRAGRSGGNEIAARSLFRPRERGV